MRGDGGSGGGRGGNGHDGDGGRGGHGGGGGRGRERWEQRDVRVDRGGRDISTVDSWNRRRDRDRIERRWGLPEFPERGVQYTFWAEGQVVAQGYNRVVYGDHGPYLEFLEGMIQLDPVRRGIPARKGRWFDSYYSKYRSVMVYGQTATVGPSPPKGKWSVDHKRPEGYADYRIGRYYISPESLGVTKVAEPRVVSGVGGRRWVGRAWGHREHRWSGGGAERVRGGQWRGGYPF